MDKIIKQKKWNTKRIFSIISITAIVLLIACSVYFTSGKSKLNVQTERITISEVTKGSFKEYIPITGIVLPQTTIYLDAAEGGRVEEKFVEDGAMLTKGQVILSLSNTDLELSLVNQETSVYNLLTQMQISKNASEQNTISKLNQMTDVESALKESERVYKMNKRLFEENVISPQEFKKSENDYIYLSEKKKLTKRILQQDSVSTIQQISQAKQSYEGSQNALNVMRKKVGDLMVRAPVDGQLTSLEAEIGQSISKGMRLGQIDVAGGFKIRAEVDEHYISRIFSGLRGECSIAEIAYELQIKKVFTQVVNGRFQVDMEFVGKVPDNIRRGQSILMRLTLSDETKALLLPRGGFYQQTGGNWIFKISKDGSTAYKTDIQLGRQNPDYYEVLQGLQPGDKVVTSSYETYGNMQELILDK